MRKLASIQKIVSVEPIANADAIERATVLGWHLVVKKGEFKAGDMAVFFEIDSLLPVAPEFGFLAKGGTKTMWVEGREYVGYRLKTVKLRGQVSQGLALPVSILTGKRFPNDTRTNPTYDFCEGMDVSAMLGVIKWEAPVPAHLAGKVKGLRPGWFPKTDEIRIQTFPKALERHRGKLFYVTEKLDGSSVSVYYRNREFGVCSRNLDLLRDENNSCWKTALALDLENKLTALGRNIVLQGEIVGHGIQKNPLRLNSQTIYFFGAYDVDRRRYLDMADFRQLIATLGLQTVPILAENMTLGHTVDQLVDYATRKSAIRADGWAEEVVMRSVIEGADEDLGRISFKVINPQYLLYE